MLFLRSIKLSFIVEDSGQGMRPEDKQKLFTKYQRFNTEANRTTEGSGLGLNITKTLAEMMDGMVTVESEYGKGSVFTVTIRQKAVDCPAIGPETAERLCSFTFISERREGQLKFTREPMPYGRVLVVDDVETNLFVAKGMLLPYRLKIDTVLSGFEVLEKVKSKESYDIIFMDHMMPKMDGIETTAKLRESGYTGIIIALTANALVGSAEKFMQKGFDGFIAKPIDVQQLNAVLNEFIRDRHPEEAANYKPETVGQDETLKIDPMVLKVFCGDAKKAIITLRKTLTDGDISLYTTTVHAMKAALMNVGEQEASHKAAELEDAGNKGYFDYILTNTEDFIQMLTAFIKAFSPDESVALDEADVIEDTAYLAEQLSHIKTACMNYDDDSAYAALDRLKKRQWKSSTIAALEEIRNALFIYSDFDMAAASVEALLEGE